MTLTEFLLARIAEDEATARAVTFDVAIAEDRYSWASVDFNEGTNAAHGRRWAPERVLAECEAKRKIVRQARLAIQTSDAVAESEGDEINNNGRKHGYAQAFDVVLDLLALPYADHPQFQAEWRL